MNVFVAIENMKKLTEERKSFSLSFMSYSYARDKSHGIVTVPRARLTKPNKKDANIFAEYMINYINLDTLEPGRCWIPLLLEFNENTLDFNG